MVRDDGWGSVLTERSSFGGSSGTDSGLWSVPPVVCQYLEQQGRDLTRREKKVRTSLGFLAFWKRALV